MNCTAEDIHKWNEDEEDHNVAQSTNIISDEESDDDGVLELPKEKIKPNEAISIFNKALEWAEGELVSQNDISVLRRLREKAVRMLLEKKKMQKQMTDFFH